MIEALIKMLSKNNKRPVFLVRVESSSYWGTYLSAVHLQIPGHFNAEPQFFNEINHIVLYLL